MIFSSCPLSRGMVVIVLKMSRMVSVVMAVKIINCFTKLEKIFQGTKLKGKAAGLAVGTQPFLNIRYVPAEIPVGFNQIGYRIAGVQHGGMILSSDLGADGG